ncbi:ELM2 domain [Arabidopsis suecica]|uniref:ELM2 domain n=1 Tax=Arabidopsis suecica TaxID=45249 RepID=A0A8T2EAX2_ARASU|nr:ELM2 domain [Arabidopsis suecica]
MGSFNDSSCSYVDVEIKYVDECEERLRRLFDQALLVFLEEEGSIKPLPAVIGDGKNVDLFKLFVLVREREGFDTVSRKRLWEVVAEKLGFDCSLVPSLILIYLKYLNRMEKWAVEESRIVNWDNKDSEKKGCYGGMLHELGNGFKSLLDNGKCQKRNRAVAFSCNHMEESCSEFDRSRKRFRESDDDDKGVGLSSVVIREESVVCAVEEGLSDFSLEKRDDLPGMLKWLALVATSPHDPAIGVIPHSSKWKQYNGNKCWLQVARAKNSLLVQRDNAELRYRYHPFRGHQNIHHPSMYEDDRKSIGRLRYSIRPPNLSKHCSSSCCNGSSLVSLSKSRSTKCRKLTIIASERAGLTAGTSRARKQNKAEIPRRCIKVGHQHQAQVDEWTESGVDSDSKWLGTRIWPPENSEALDQTLGNDLVGKGRPDSCSCELSGFVECTRLHIAEKRMELKRELGDDFFHWRFNQMGEEVCLRWTEEEEKRFKDMIIADPQSFWTNAAKNFPKKKREELVSYYFNVFLINRRRYQNRVTPKSIDSDDEGAFGSVGGSFGRDAVTSSGSDVMICAQNRQCEDY